MPVPSPTYHPLAGILLALLLVAGCAGSRAATDRPDLPAAFPNHSTVQIQHFLAAQADTVQAISARASLALRTPEQNANLSATLVHRRGDSLYMSVSPGLGIEAGRMLVTPDSFFIYDRIKKKLTYGSLAYAANLVPIPVSGDDAFRALLGLTVPDADVAWQIEADEQYYHLHHPATHQRFIIDPRIWRVVRYEVRTPSGEIEEARSYAEFDTFDGLFLPRRVTFERPLDDTRAGLYFRDVDVNPDDLSFDLRVSSDVQRILVDEHHASP